MIEVCTCLSRDTHLVQVVLNDGETAYEMEPALAERIAERVLEALVNADDHISLELGPCTAQLTIQEAKKFVLLLFKVSISSTIENNFVGFLSQNMGVAPEEHHVIVAGFRAYNAQMAEDEYMR